MIYFVYGKDTYRIKKTIDAMRKKYEDSSSMNISIFEDNYDLEKICADIIASPFLAKKRLVIIKNILSSKDIDGKKLAEVLDNKPDSTIVLFTEEGEPDKRKALYKRLIRAKSRELNALQGSELIKWIRAETDRQGGQIENREANMLSGYYGGDLWQLKNEIQKLINYNKEITEENIEKLSVANVHVKIFDLTDAITQKNKGKTFKILKDLLDTGENEMYILSMIQWQVRNLALVYDLKDLSEREIASKAKMNPYAVKKTLPAVRLLCHSRTGSKPSINSGGNPGTEANHANSNFGLKVIKNYYALIINAENDIKTGAKDPDVALELLINKLTD